MTREIIHFSHANGFPAETYRKFFSFLEDSYRIGYISMHGHDPNYPVTDNWPELVKELLFYLEKNYHQPVIGVGHSLGGVLTFLAAMQRPELFKSIIMLDSPIPGKLRSRVIFLAKWLRLLAKLMRAEGIQTRRVEWHDETEAIAYFKHKTIFAHFDADCLQDYVHYGTEKTAHGIRLKYDRNIEYQIFRTLPHDLSKHSQPLQVPGTLIYGLNSRFVNAIDIKYMQKQFHIESVPIVGSHLFPFEHPQQTAELLRNIITSL